MSDDDTQGGPSAATRPGPPGPRWLPGPAAGARGLPWRSSLAVAAVQVIGSTLAGRDQTQRVSLNVLGYALLLVGPALLLLRRRAPALVAAGTATAALAYLAAGYPYGPVFLSIVVAFFTAVVAGHRRAVLTVAVLVYAGHVLVSGWLYRWLPPDGDSAVGWGAASAAGAWVAAVLAGAELFRVRREQSARERRERADAEARRADEERLRIARELHDVLAHSISVINVQSGVALALLDDHPEQVRAALTTIRGASKEALDEVRQVLSTLRPPSRRNLSGEAPRSPAPGLARLPELAEQAGAAGLRVELATGGDPAPLPPGADLAAFRIVQEALTNVVRHSGSRTARVRLRYADGTLELRVDDDGPATGDGDTCGGNGLIGMRERAAALGGTVQAGPRPDGGFRVRALLPVRAGTVRPTEGEDGR